MSRKDHKVSRDRRPKLPPDVPSLARGHVVALLALSALGFVLSAYLMFVHHRVRAEPGWQSACAISSTFDCDAVSLSPYSSVAGAPLAAIGAWFYVVTAIIGATGLRRPLHRLPRSPAMLLFVAALLATTLSLLLAVVSGVAIGALCVVCAGLYAVNVSMLVIAWRALRQAGETLPKAWRAERRHWSRHPGISLGVSLGAVVSFLAIFFVYSKVDSAAGSEVCAAVAEAARAESPVSIVMYTDFQCPPCNRLDSSLRPIRDRLRITHRHYPLDITCNPRANHTRHPGACLQARAAICAGQAGRYNEYSDRLFDGGPTDAGGLVALAMKLGLSRASFESCLQSEESSRELQTSIDAAIANEVRATPTVFIGSRRHVGRLSEADLRCLSTDLEKPRTSRAAGSPSPLSP